MAGSEAEHISIRCPECQKRLKVPMRMAGKRVACPACKAMLNLPSFVTSSSDDDWLDVEDDSPGTNPIRSTPVAKNPIASNPSTNILDQDLDDDFFKLADESTPTTAKAKSLGQLGVDLSDLDLEELNNPPVASSSTHSSNRRPSKTSGSMKSQSAVPIEQQSNSSEPTEFRFPCKVCGTFQYAKVAEVGSLVRCPDCYSQFSIPSPPPGWNKKRSIGPVTLEDDVGVKLADVVATAQRSREPTARSADDLLAKAAQELEKEEVKSQLDVYDFDSSGWFKQTFSFLGDPSVLVIAGATGFLLGGVFVASQAAGNMLAQRSESGEQFGILMVLMLLGIPLLCMTLANGVAILEAAANKIRRITSWPAFNPGEAIGEFLVVVVAFALAALPGGLLGWFAPALGIDPRVGVGACLLSTCILMPVFLLSMLDNQSAFEPISLQVIGSTSKKPDAWAAMYLLSSLAMFSIFIVYLMSTGGSSTMKFAFGMVIPIAVFFIFHQYGVLAARIADVTSLEFETDDEEEGYENTSESNDE